MLTNVDIMSACSNETVISSYRGLVTKIAKEYEFPAIKEEFASSSLASNIRDARRPGIYEAASNLILYTLEVGFGSGLTNV